MTQIQSEPTSTALAKVPMVNVKKKRPLMSWFYRSPQEVMDIFAALPDAVKIGEGDKQFVFVPGTRKDKALLVAHADTVNHDNFKPNVGYKDGVYFSNTNAPIGADDRAGCAILWNLRNSGHSLLIPNGEESGCIGSRFLMTLPEWKKKIAEHQFAIEFDRMNSSDLVFYSVASKEYQEWCHKQFVGYKYAPGSFTDICHLCEEISGLNISVGYYGQHSGREILRENEWHRTLQMSRKVLEQELPRFPFEKPKYNYYGNRSYYGGYDLYSDDYDDYKAWFEKKEETDALNVKPTPPVQQPIVRTVQPNRFNEKVDNSWLVVCKGCDGMMDIAETRKNEDKCVFCNRKMYEE